MLGKCFGEFMGTLVLVLLGDGVVANVLLKRSKAEGAGWMVIASGWAFAVMAGVFTAIACGSSDAHLNPAVTIGFAVSTGHFAKFAPYLVAQMAGAFTGAILVWLHFLPHWEETPDQALKLVRALERAREETRRLRLQLSLTFVPAEDLQNGNCVAQERSGISRGLPGGQNTFLHQCIRSRLAHATFFSQYVSDLRSSW
jgi:glycerol uptake facilitator-like aquaporin